MRETLFRGKRSDTGEWAYGGILRYGEEAGEHSYIITGIFNRGFSPRFIEVAPGTDGQYTGLKDRNGARIFEGDIVRYCESEEYGIMEERDEKEEGEPAPGYWSKGVVEWQGERGRPCFDLKFHPFENNALIIIFDEDYAVEVIGNIHDSPELANSDDKGRCYIPF
jgi:hypothetical protein